MSQATTRGTVVKMGDKDIRFLPLNWASLEELQGELDLVASMGAGARKTVFFSKEEREAILRVVSTAVMTVNGVDLDWVKKNLDLANIGPVLEAVFTTNGYASAEDASEGSGAGEQKAVESGS